MPKVLFGIGSIAQLVYSFSQNESSVNPFDCFTLNGIYIGSDDQEGLPLPLVPFEQLTSYFECTNKDIEIVVCIGYNKMNSIREKVFNALANEGYQIGGYIHPTAVISPDADISDGLIAFENVVIQPFAKLGKGNILWCNATIAHHTKIGDFNFLAPSASIAGDATIGNKCFFGNNSTIRNGVTIDDACLVGANCYVGKDLSAESVLLAARPYVSDKKSSNYSI